MKTKYLSKYGVFVNAPDDKLDWIVRFVRDWYQSDTNELLPVRACQFTLDFDYNYTVYASGADFGCYGLVKIYQRNAHTGKIWKKFNI